VHASKPAVVPDGSVLVQIHSGAFSSQRVAIDGFSNWIQLAAEFRRCVWLEGIQHLGSRPGHFFLPFWFFHNTNSVIKWF
jgi:hypothetical protein